MTTKADTTGLEYQSPEWFEACAAIRRGQMAGRRIQRRNEGGAWEYIQPPAWLFEQDYRLAPEPREVWVEFDADGDLRSATNYEFPGATKFREVIE